MSVPLVEKLYRDNTDLSAYLLAEGEVSFKSQVDDGFKKVLLLAAASNLEYSLTAILLNFSKTASRDCQPLISFVQNKAISRQFHTYFTWERSNANSFFGLFGELLRDQMKADVSSDVNLDYAVRAFLELGNARNTMVHEDYASFYLDKTHEEIYQLYVKAQAFLRYVEGKLAEAV